MFKTQRGSQYHQNQLDIVKGEHSIVTNALTPRKKRE
jgi:hypothetical protein